MTELEAVNEMLMSIGQAPVNTLAVTGIKDVSIARARLSSMTRRVLSRGFNFNTDEDYPLTPDSEGIILVPEGTLKIEGMSATDDFTTRRHPKGLALYNKTDRTFTFPAGITVKIVWAFAFEDCPETARCYIATAAGRRFQSKAIGSQILDRFEEEDEMKAWLLLERDERGQRKTNLFRNNATLAGFGSRSY
ncbi:hypothetical protein L284_17150 [Novosphingobium lindaniclasticum LE124]|uniref:Tail tubular protein A n=2 Tax=Novosphingobium TaxID=165696 RepID=T0HE89_9SPHN|nr:hypothetical protein L284_17150 [Novosphingobium lindaniclasticum LE124]